jgi:hypothetical protein
MAEKEIKRMNFFDGQFLKEGEFIDEQYYHLHMRRRMNYILFENAGVINVNSDDLKFINIDNSNKTFRVKAGMAISRNDDDMEAKEIILRQDSPTLNLNDEGITSGQTAYVTIHYEEELANDPPSEGDIAKETRVKEKAVVEVHSSKPTGPAPNGEEYILLGALNFDNMESLTPTSPDYSERQEAKIRASLLGVGSGPTLVSISVQPASVTLNVGDTRTLTATGNFSDGSSRPLVPVDGLTWTSSNDPVATINVTGAVTGVAPGSAQITASAQGRSDTANVTVNISVPAPVIQTDPQFDPTAGRPGNEVTVFGKNFGVDLPNFPTVTLIDQSAAIPPIEAVVMSVSATTSPETIVFRVPAIQGQTSSVDMTIRVTTTGGFVDSTAKFRWRPPLS